MSKNQEEMWLLKEKYKGEKTTGFFADLERLQVGEPLGYVIGHTPFLDCQIYLDSKPLIPRPETEYWVEKAILTIINDSKNRKDLRVLDLCAGSGAIGVAVAKAVGDVYVTFAEIDPAHLPTIEKNLRHNLPDYSNRLEYFKVIGSDLFEKIEGKFDFILTNPPYIDPVIDRAEESVKNHEPHLALYGGKDGVQVILTIINDSKNHLAPGGQLWIEHEPEQSKAIAKNAEAAGFRAVSHKDQYGVERYSILTFIS